MITQNFPSLDSLTDYVRKGGTFPGFTDSHNDSWYGGTLAESMKFATTGWPEGAKLASEKSDRIADRLVGMTADGGFSTEMAYDTMGAALDFGAYYAGVPECWARPTIEPTKNAIHIVTNVCASSGVSSETLRTRGLAVAALVLALTAKGYPVIVDVQQRAKGNSGKGKGLNTTVRILDGQGSQVDVDRLVFALGHPTMFRHLLRQAAIIKAKGTEADKHEAWANNVPIDERPEGCTLYLGGAHLSQVERWRDGGEKWIIEEYLRQTQG